MKKIFAMLLIAAMSLTLISCSSKENTDSETAGGGNEATEAASDLLTEIKDRGYMVVAMEGTWQPWTFHDENDELTGFDVDVANAIGKQLGVDVQFVEVQWDSIFAGLDSGRYDIVCNGVGYTDERAEKYSFTDPYVYTDVVLMVKGDNTDINSFEDLNGKTTANTITSTYAKLAEKYGATVTGVDDLIQTIELLEQGRIDATLNSVDSYNEYMSEHPDADIKVVAEAPGDKVCMPIRKDASTESFVEAVNEALQALRDSGELAEISVKWFGADKTVEG